MSDLLPTLEKILIDIFIIFIIFAIIVDLRLEKESKTKKKTQRAYFNQMKQMNPSYAKTIEYLLNNSLMIDEIIDLYKNFFSSFPSSDKDYHLVCHIIIALKEKNAFPKEVNEWLDDPYYFDFKDLVETINEFITIRERNIDSKTAIMAFSDGFLSLDEALKYIDKYRYPKTIELMKKDTYDRDELKESIKQDEKGI